MEAVTVNKADLITKIKENRDEHRKIFEEALEGYKKEMLSLLEKHIDDLKGGKVRRVMVNLPMPEDHTRDYDRVIAMLEMDVNDTVAIPEHEFQAYVLDDWQWQHQFLTSSSAYSALAAQKLGS